MGWTAGKRQIRTRRAIVNILRDYPEGLSAPELQAKLEESSTGRRAAPTNNAIAQLCKRTPGVIRMKEDKLIPTGIGDTTRSYAVYILHDEQAFNAWADR